MKYGLIGERLPHSFSKEIHEALGRYSYELCELERDDVRDFITKKEFEGINVTIPYKEAVMPYLDFISDEAKKIGAVNVVVNRNGKLYGYNTDFSGMKLMILKADIDIKGGKVLILGSGGTSKTAFAVSEHLGAREIYIVSRTPAPGEISYDDALKNHADTDFIINCTPVGMYPKPDVSPIYLDGFENLSGVIDVIYNPLRTKLICDAKKRNIKTVGGLYMLVSQAMSAAEYFLNEKIDESITEKIYKNILSQKENIVLIGMPGCGKSTVGEALAKRLGRELYDTDAELEKKIGSVTDFITTHGETAFRAEEKEVIRELCIKASGAVISTGGGAVLDCENTDRLKRSGKIYFIDRNIDLIVPTSSRPLSSNREALEKRYRERYGIYTASCHKRIENNKDKNSVINAIAEDFEN